MNIASTTLPVAELYRDHHAWLRAWLSRKLGCAHHAADLAHDTFERILASRDLLLGIDQPRAFLTTTAKRLMIDRARRQAVEHAYLSQLVVAAEASEGDCSPEQILEAVQALDEISAVLADVSPNAREAFLLHYLDDLAHAEVARRLGVSERMVRKYLARVLLICQPLFA